jgi:hypothetical protein
VRPNTVVRVVAPVVMALATAAGLSAQAGPQPQPDNPAKLAASRFETVLRNAIEDAGRQLALQARQFAPGIELLVSDPAIARGVQLKGYGYFFDVQAPDIRSTLIALEDMMSIYNRRGGTPALPVGAPGESVSAPAAPSVVPFDPDQAYTTFVRESLIDAVLDNSAMLPVVTGESLSVAVSGIDRPDPNPLYRRSPNKLVITIHAADLIEFRQGRISRAQARERITQERF